MASNPIKRRARQSFFLGFLIALVAMALIVMVLFTRISKLSQENEKLKIKGPQIKVYTANRDIEPGEIVKVEDLTSTTMNLAAGSTGIEVENYVTPDSFVTVDEQTESSMNVIFTANVQIQSGTVVTIPMLHVEGTRKEEDDPLIEYNHDQRIMEFSTIVLPSQLNNGDYVDIRLRMPEGAEYVVLAKKKVEQTNDTTIWMKMSELDILTLNSAMVDCYLTKGSTLRATIYTDPLMQQASTPNYPISGIVAEAVDMNPNVLSDAKSELYKRWNNTSVDGQNGTDFQKERNLINSYSSSLTEEEKMNNIETAVTQETTDMATRRSDYVTALEGTGIVGTNY